MAAPRSALRVLVSTSTFGLDAETPLPRFVDDLAAALARKCEVTVLAPGAPGAPEREAVGEVEVRRFTYFRPRRLQKLAYGAGMRDNMRGSVLAKLQVPCFLATQVLATRRALREKKCQIVNSHWMVPQGLSTALLRGRTARFRHVLQVHAGDVYMLKKLPFGKAVARYVIRRVDHVFAAGSHVRETLDELLGFPSNAAIRSMGVDTALFGGEESGAGMDSPFEDGYILFFGRFSEKKGVEYLLRAMPRVLEHHPRTGLVIIGYGPREEQLRDLASECGVEARVEFRGRQSHETIVQALRGCRLAVVPSVIDASGETEGMPTVVVEAMAAGVRVVGSAVDGIPDVIENGVNGWLCREKDPEDLAAKMLLALSDSEPSTVRKSALESGRRFDWERVAEDYLEAFRRLLPEVRGSQS